MVSLLKNIVHVLIILYLCICVYVYIVTVSHSQRGCAAALTPCEPKSRQYVFESQAEYTCVTHLCIFIL